MIPPLASFTNHFSVLLGAEKADWDHCAALKEGVPGWSKIEHYLFFRELLRSKAKPEPLRILVCGVYHGLDMRYIAGLAEKLGQKIELVGVDLFEDKPCADWPEEQRKEGVKWVDSIHKAPPPDMEAAKRNVPTAEISKCDSVSWIHQNLLREFDIIYLDTSHDEQTVRDEIEAALRILAVGGLLAGDDYAGGCSNWGVSDAVQSLLPNHIVLFNRIWVAQAP
jgi:hypothetical protein